MFDENYKFKMGVSKKILHTTKDNILDKYTFYRKSGRSIIEHCPVFSPDGESLVIIVENILREYNILTGDCVRILETEKPINELISVEFLDEDLYGCSNDGLLTIWTWEKGAVLKETKLEIPHETKVLTFNLIDRDECFITMLESKQNCLKLGTYSLKTGQLLYTYDDTRPRYYNLLGVALGWCDGDRFAAIINGSKKLFIQSLHQPHLKSVIININNFRLTAVAGHKKENCIAVADTLGHTTIIRGNLYDYHSIAREVMHWHFLPPLALCFSLNGNYLLTGGMEKVLVRWTLGDLANKVNEKTFIPRLPGMIRHIATNNTHIALSLVNNSVVIASAQMRVHTTILECGGLSPVTRAVGTSLIYHKSLGALLMGGRTGHLQVYSTKSDKVLYNIDITNMNSIPAARHNLIPLETEVRCAAISGNGVWLATSEYRHDGVNYSEETLKFWQFQKNNSSPFILNTCVNLSHGGCEVINLALDNHGKFCVSAGADQKFRIWKLTKNSEKKKLSWSCLTACYYSSGSAQFLSTKIMDNFKYCDSPQNIENYPYLKQIKGKKDVIAKLFNIHKENDILTAVNLNVKKNDEFDLGELAISQDGSLIAVWFGSKLTLWDTHLCNLRTVLSSPVLRPKGVHVKFGTQDAAHYLACTTKDCLAVWSILSLTIKWMVQLNATCIASDPFSNKMAVVTSNNDIYIFNPHSSTPILSRKQLLKPETGVFKHCTFGASSGNDVRLYLMRNNAEIYCLEPRKNESSQLETLSKRNAPMTKFSAMIAEQQLSEVQMGSVAPDEIMNTEVHANNAVTQFISSAPHMLPPVSLLSTSFLDHISGFEDIKQNDDIVEDTSEVDASSSDEEETKVSTLNEAHAPTVAELWAPNYEDVNEKKLQKILRESLINLQITKNIFGPM